MVPVLCCCAHDSNPYDVTKCGNFLTDLAIFAILHVCNAIQHIVNVFLLNIRLGWPCLTRRTTHSLNLLILFCSSKSVYYGLSVTFFCVSDCTEVLLCSDGGSAMRQCAVVQRSSQKYTYVTQRYTMARSHCGL